MFKREQKSQNLAFPKRKVKNGVHLKCHPQLCANQTQALLQF